LLDVLTTISSYRFPYTVYDFSSISDIYQSLPSADYVVIHDSKLDPSNISPLRALCREVISIEVCPNIKDFSYISTLIDKLLSIGPTKSTHLICLGGGSLQDLIATVSSLLYRGLPWLFIPSSPLSVADSCIGSKSSINYFEKKNIIGCFYPPHAVYLTTDFLSTASNIEFLSGYGDILHYLIPSSFHRRSLEIDQPWNSVTSLDLFQKYSRLSLLTKKPVIECDEFDLSSRQIFNYGHTFGHALESSSSYSIPHGLAVLFGISIANELSCLLGHLSRPLTNRIDLIISNFLNKFFSSYHGSLQSEVFTGLVNYLKNDKKNTTQVSFNYIGVSHVRPDQDLVLALQAYPYTRLGELSLVIHHKYHRFFHE